MSSSSVSSGCSLTRQRKCLCGDEVVLKLFGTDMNPGRRFLGCRKYLCGKAIILEHKETIGKMEKRIKNMQEKAKSFEDKAKEYEKKAQEYEDKAKEFDDMTQVYEWKIKEMKRMERKKIKEARTMERNFWMKLLVALLVLVMENGEKKTLTSFCYWGGEWKVNANVTFLYNGEMCVSVLLEEGSKVNELREKELMVTDNISSPGGTLALPSSSQVSNSCSQEMGLVQYLQENANEILTGKGQLFDSPDLFKQSMLLFAASNKSSFNYLDNSRAYYRLVCYLRPVLKLDACFLTGYYWGHVLSASTHDADDGLCPLAYAIVSSDNDDDWLWFLINLKEVLGGCQVVLVTDQNTSLLNGIIKVFGEDCNAWCLRHLKENFNKFVISKGLKAKRRNTNLKVVNDLGNSRTEDSFKYHLGKLYGISANLSKCVEDNNPKHWSNAFFPYKIWDKMYTNLAKCFNSWILPLRKWKLLVGKQIENDIKKSSEYARKFSHCNSSPTEFIVANDTRQLYAVKLIPRTCNCLAWQISGIPCAHATRAIQSSGFSIYDMVDPFLKKEMQVAIYEDTMSPVPLHDMPSASSFLVVNELNDNNVDENKTQGIAQK
ncbi:hypothetical protein RHSIM_Rhsim08G0151700 [Rhododendron simsii]|uniref:SWIM-type domain-containing protein n=1 Tax=Rhododendron simsii TaxID=118357 RepID=A0A834GIW4_RHOSS|nr:hypothetical protein RHSIM_Rhsim08G0151700 [Rhododendron simsii]